MHKKIGKLPYGAIILSLTLIILLVGGVYLKNKVESDSKNPFTLQFNGGRDDSSYVEINVTVEKSWINDEGLPTQTVGAQYNGEVVNGYTSDIENWQLVLLLDQDATLDSSWNGEYTVEGNRMVLVPDANTCIIPAGEAKPFGFIMISKELMEFNNFELLGYRETTYTQYPMFWVLVVSAGIWVICFFTYVIVSLRMRQFIKRRESDAKIISQSMRTFAELIDAKDKYTRGHSIRVSYYAKEIGRRMGLKEDEVRTLGYIALMHDCGKIGVSDTVLTKPSKLEPSERKEIEEHTIRGGNILDNFTAIEGIRDGALYHHERFDGTGYPQGLKGLEIPLCARIICVADAYDAMSSDRCYRTHLDKDKIIQEFKENSGTQFDPEPARHILDMIEDGYCDKAKKIK